jgi:SAM-dependent methyltransferase
VVGILTGMDHPDDRKFHHANVARLDAPDRTLNIPPAAVQRAVAPRPGERIADLGCGTGFFLWPLLESVAGEGTFYAVDSSPEMLEHLQARAEQQPNGQRVQAVLSTDSAVPLPDASLDVAVMGSVYHEIAERPAYLLEVKRLLRPGGRLVAIDWHPLPPGAERTVGPPAHHRVAEEAARAELLAAGFTVQSRSDFELLWCLEAVKP